MPPGRAGLRGRDRKSTRLNSSHVKISYAVFCHPRALHSFPTRRSSDLCDLIAIPHNTNLSAGSQLVGERSDGTPLSEEDALIQAEIEPLVEIYQHKGESECLPGAPGSEG